MRRNRRILAHFCSKMRRAHFAQGKRIEKKERGGGRREEGGGGVCTAYAMTQKGLEFGIPGTCGIRLFVWWHSRSELPAFAATVCVVGKCSGAGSSFIFFAFCGRGAEQPSRAAAFASCGGMVPTLVMSRDRTAAAHRFLADCSSAAAAKLQRR